jgi:hypothetical protein
MTSLGTAFVTVKPDLSGVSKGIDAKFRKVGDQAGGDFAKGFKAHPGLLSLGKIAAGSALAGIGAFAVVAKGAVAAATESEKVGKQTNAVLKSTGTVAGVTAKHVGDLATAISQKTGVDDEAIQSSENLLLTFTNVRNQVGKGNDVFDRATKTITDMSVALGQDGKSSAIQLGKALNDPVKGVSALARVGVSFTAQQKDQIKTLVKSGKTLDAQKIILREINKEFGGSAAAQAQPLDKLKVAVGNLQEALGGALKPAVDGVATSLNGFAVKALPTAQRAADDVAAVFKRTDISFGEKLKLSTEDVHRDLQPTIDALELEFKNAHVGDKIGQAIEAGVPKIVDAAAAAAPHAAGAFVNAFKNAGPWGKLLTVAFLAQKLGAFSAAGNAASGLFVRGISKAIGGPLANVLRRNGETAAANAAEGFASHIGTSVQARGGRITSPFRTRGALAGRAFGAALSAGALAATVGLGVLLAARINQAFSDALEGLGILKRPAAKNGPTANGMSTVPGQGSQHLQGTLKKLAKRLGLPFATGGLVPGTGFGDTVSARLTPGEFVMRKPAVQAIGVDVLARMNGTATIATRPAPQRFASGGPVFGTAPPVTFGLTQEFYGEDPELVARKSARYAIAELTAELERRR